MWGVVLYKGALAKDGMVMCRRGRGGGGYWRPRHCMIIFLCRTVPGRSSSSSSWLAVVVCVCVFCFVFAVVGMFVWFFKFLACFVFSIG